MEPVERVEDEEVSLSPDAMVVRVLEPTVDRPALAQPGEHLATLISRSSQWSEGRLWNQRAMGDSGWDLLRVPEKVRRQHRSLTIFQLPSTLPRPC